MASDVDLSADLSGRQLKALVARGHQVDHPPGHEVAAGGSAGCAGFLGTELQRRALLRPPEVER
ncbi:MAG: hypothetical protein ACR2FG_03160 [Marmoricola sp.]